MLSNTKKKDYIKEQIELSVGRGIFPGYVYEKIVRVLKRAKLSDSEENITILKLQSYGEYFNKLTMIDKSYKSRIHDYGTKEELLFSFNSIIPGYYKYHKYLSRRGIMVTESDIKEPKVSSTRTENIIIVKETSWDSNINDSKSVTYYILFYVPNSEYEYQKACQAKETIKHLQDELKKGGLS